MFYEALQFSVYLVLVYMTVFFFLGLILKNNSIVDIAWGLGFVIITWLTYFWFGIDSWPQMLLSVLVSIWGLRLFYHILKRNWAKPEDFRYQNWRKQWGKWVIPRSFLQIFMLQGFLMLLIALPIIFINSYGGELEIYWVLAGLLVWIFGFYWEAVGDYQLKKFVKTKKPGEIMTKGLWKYTRHPNYFGEAVMWWGIWLIAMSGPGAWFTVLSPIVITVLVRFVSGVPMLEKKYEGNKDFEEYKKKTNAFIPWFPKQIK